MNVVNSSLDLSLVSPVSYDSKCVTGGSVLPIVTRDSNVSPVFIMMAMCCQCL